MLRSTCRCPRLGRSRDGPGPGSSAVRAELAPRPGVEHLGELIEGFRAAGLPVDLEVDGPAAVLPPGVNVSAYRIVQEALTNALRHAGPAHAHVHFSYLNGAVELEVSDDGTGDGTRDAGVGHGLIGMCERVSVYGGRLEAGGRPSGGFLIRAQLPYEPVCCPPPTEHQ